MFSIIGRVASAGLALLLAVASVAAQDRRQNQPGQFDFYVLSLSWSPSFCESAGERGTPPQQQCAARPYSFVVHGLWPQYEKGFPEFCQQPAPDVRERVCRRVGKNLEGDRQKRISCQHGGGLVECHMRCWAPATKIVVIHAWQIVMDE